MQFNCISLYNSNWFSLIKLLDAIIINIMKCLYSFNQNLNSFSFWNLFAIKIKFINDIGINFIKGEINSFPSYSSLKHNNSK